MNRWLVNSVLVLFAAPTVFVLYWAVEPESAGSLIRLTQTVLPGYVTTTVLLAAVTLGLALVIGAGAAYVVTFFAFPARALLNAALVLPLALPSYLLAIVYREMSHLQQWPFAVENVWGAAVIMALTLYPYVFLLARATFRRQATSHIDAGKALGVGGLRLTRRVLLPLTLPALSLSGILVVIEVISDIGTVEILGVSTLTTAVRRIWLSAFDPVLAIRLALLTALIPLLMVCAYGMLTWGRAFHVPTNRPRPPQPIPLTGTWRWAAPLICLMPVILGFVVPVVALMNWAAEVFYKIDLSGLFNEIFNTLLLAAVATVFGLAAGLWFAVTGRQAAGRRWSLVALWLVSLNYALPAMVLAFAALMLTGWLDRWGVGEWLGGTMALLIAAVTLRYTVFAHMTAESGLQMVSPRLDDAVRCAGRSRFEGLLRVLLPLTRGSLLVGGLLVFVNAIKELTLSLMLQPFGYSSLSMSAYHFAKVDAYQQGSVYALCLVLIGLYPVLSIHRWFGGR